MYKSTLLLLFILLNIGSINSQNKEYDQLVLNLKETVKTKKGTEKVILLDSLTRLVEFNEELGYTPLANETIALAILEDQYEISTRLTNDLIYYNTSILGNLDEALQIFDDYKKKELTLTKYRQQRFLIITYTLETLIITKEAMIRH